MNEYENRLAREKSPYLLQHAHNPVAWFPWGKEAFEKAGQEEKLVFLSIGYSTCHWCHVMARESFEDEEVAELLNEKYISVKVDKEERPDIDMVYMEICQRMTGHGGWPLTLLLTPEQKPVFAGTYFPKRRRHGMPGLLEILEEAAEAWKNDKDKLLYGAERLTSQLYDSREEKRHGTELTKEILHRAVSGFASSYDRVYGGFGTAPKFPMPHQLLFLLRYGKLEHNEEAAKMAYHTLLSMYRGGIYDHPGGGFSRYSTDEKWLIPHFEKMLYDNALLSYVYLEAYQASGETLFRQIAESVFSYMLRELTDGSGGFFCGQDADSEGEEGKYYVFSKEEILDALGEENGMLLCDWYHVSETGNFEGKTVLNLLENTAFADANPRIATLNGKLLNYRRGRTRLHRDDKVLTSWNGLAIAAFAKGYQTLGEESYLSAAKRAEEFIFQKLSDENGRLKIRYRDGESVGTGQLYDYAFVAWGELELYRADFDVAHLDRAVRLVKWMIQLFWDQEQGGFYFCASDAEQLISRPKEIYDGAVPSGNGVAALLLVQLDHLTGEVLFRDRAKRQLEFLAERLPKYPVGESFTLLGMLEELYAYRELVCVAKEEAQLEEVRELLSKRWNKNLAVLMKTEENAGRLAALCPYTADYEIEEGRAVYYLCQDGACMPKVYELSVLEELLNKE